MSTTITIRTDDALREALDRRAADRGTTVSELVREILEDAVAEVPLSLRVGHLRGRLRLPAQGRDSWSKRIRQRNWRP